MIDEKGRKTWAGENRFYRGEDNIINVAIGKGLDENTAIAMREAFYKLIDKGEGKSKVIVDNSKTGKPSTAARRIFKEMTEHEKVGKIAVYGISPVARMIASFVVGYSKNKNIKIFNRRKEAYAWLKEGDIDKLREVGEK